jgi:hypothetical protein
MNSLLRLALVASSLTLTLASTAPAHAAPMTPKEFLALIEGTYGSLQPSADLLFSRFIDPAVYISERNGKILLENFLAVGSKVGAATYEITRYECYTHAITSTTCEFSLQLLDPGHFVHFMGVTPSVSVEARGEILKLVIDPGYSVAGASVPAVILQKR